jgi:serine protease
MKRIITYVGASLCLLAATATAQTAKLAGGIRQFVLPETMVEDVDYVKGHIIFQVKEQYRSQCTAGYINDNRLTQVINYLNVNTLGKIYPNHQPPAEKYNSLGQKYADLSLIYELTFKNTGVTLEKAINLMLSTGLFEYAEPRYQYKLEAFVPNDPSVGSQSYLTAIKAYVSTGFGGAWDTSDPLVGAAGQGDTNVVVAIVDSGSDLDHPDLVNQFKHNYADPVNGADDDLDGYTDNFTGWDLGGADYTNVVGDNDANIMGANNNHGSHVSGCAGAQCNNGVGVCGTGFKCKLLPVKCAADNDTRGSGGVGYIIAGYEGITYAADHGAKVINCSWGGSGGGSYGQSICDYASINKNAIVVAACGNNGLDEAFYPAAFNYVMSVAATTSTNSWLTKASFSNFNYSVDISGPGNNIYNTVYNNGYTSMSGTSMASPVVAGGVALVLAKFPSYTGLQAGQRLITTSDPINAANPAYANKLGGGRINLYKALTNAAGPSVVFTNQLVDDHNDLAFVQNDTLFISGDFVNYLSPTSSACTATISIASGTGVTAITNSYPLGVLNSNQSVNNVSAPFKYRVTTATQNATVTFKVTITDGSYSQNYFFNVLLNPDYVNIAINDVATTMTSKGKFGWNADGASVGLGFSYMGTQLLYEGGLMIGSSSTKVSDCVRGATAGSSDTDFGNLVVAQKTGPTVSDFDAYARFNDAPASPTQNITVRQKGYAWTSAGSRKFVIFEYVLVNTGSTGLTNGFAGIFTDWDIDAATYAQNKADYDASRKLGYSWYSGASGKYAGVKLLTTSASPNFYALDNISGGGGGIDISSAYSTADKYSTLSTFRQSAGQPANTGYAGNDVISVMSTGPFTIAAGDSIKVAFAILAGDDLTDLQKSADTAQIRWDNLNTTGINNNTVASQPFMIYPNPATDALNFVIGSNQSDAYTISLYSVIGEVVKTAAMNASGAGIHNANVDVSDLAPGTYIYKVSDKSGKARMGKVVIKH